MRKKITFALLSLLLVPLAMMAQNVTISPSSGTIVAGKATDNDQDSGLKAGFGSLWRHEQLQLTMTTSDFGRVTAAGALADPSCAIGVWSYTTSSNNVETATSSYSSTDPIQHLFIAGGKTQTFIVVALPKGYRITGYEMVLQPNLGGINVKQPSGSNKFELVAQNMAFYETEMWESTSPYTPTTNSTGTDAYVISDYKAVATCSDKTSNKTIMESGDASREFTISRTSQNANDMGNQLYFFLGRATDNYYGVTIKSFEIWFTAEGNFETTIVPQSIVGSENTDYITTPFKTSKIDVGAMTQNNDVYSYHHSGVRDLIAYTHLYQDNAYNTSTGVPEHKTATDAPKNIHPVEIDGEGLYAFGNDTYFVEPPTTMNTATGLAGQPIGLRVVGATFKYQYGKTVPATKVEIAGVCRISYKYSGSTYYLDTDLTFDKTTTTDWKIDEYGNIYTGEGEFIQYLACYGDQDTRQLTLSSSATGSEAFYNLHVDLEGNSTTNTNYGCVYYTSRSNTRYYLNFVYHEREGGSTHNRGYVIKEGTTHTYYQQSGNGNNQTLSEETVAWNGQRATATISGTEEVDIPAFTPGDYTLKIYGTDKTTPVKTINVTSGVSDTYELNNLNNDAVKFEIEGLTGDALALVTVTLKMQALDPYINKMDIVCTGEKTVNGQTSKLELTQQFTASDFRVSGGAFTFYIPTDWAGVDLNFFFRDLYSNTGDYEGNGNARYSFVTSPYFSAFDNYVNNAVAPTPTETLSWNNDATADNGLYDTRYSPTIDKKYKIYTNVAGDKAFAFSGTVTGSDSKDYIVEYPFSVERYRASTSTTYENNGKGTGGSFNAVTMNTTSTNSGTYYLFTADETKYNIAPTFGMEHRNYAFYRMDINLVSRSYTPTVAWTKIYGVTAYADQDANGNDVEGTKSMWGAKLGTEEGTTAQPGYLSAYEIQTALSNNLGASGSTTAPESLDQILYVDASELSTIVSSADVNLPTLRGTLAPNALFYLPKNMTQASDNFAVKTSGGSFVAGQHIVLTDRKPFYAPYPIQVNAANYAKYDRKITWKTQGKNTLQTVLLPFGLDLQDKNIDGKTLKAHVNTLDNTMFTMNRMVADNCLSIEDAEVAQNFAAKAYFAPITSEKSEANVPYMVNVVTAPADATKPFTVAQTGAKVEASVLPSDHANDYIWEGETANGYIGAGETNAEKTKYNFQNYASYSGKTLTAADGYFYFAGGMYLNSKNIKPSVSEVLIMYPFRAYFGYNVSSTAKRMGSMEVVFGENETSGIDALETTIPVTLDENAPVYDIQGRMIAPALRDLNGKKLPRGVYVISGMKIIVK